MCCWSTPASDFTALRGDNGEIGYTMVELSGANVRKQVLKLAPKHDHIVIDVGGRDTAAMRAALTVSDTAIIPVQPRSFDMWALEMMEELIGEMRAFSPELAAFIESADRSSEAAGVGEGDPQSGKVVDFDRTGNSSAIDQERKVPLNFSYVQNLLQLG